MSSDNRCLNSVEKYNQILDIAKCHLRSLAEELVIAMFPGAMLLVINSFVPFSPLITTKPSLIFPFNTKFETELEVEKIDRRSLAMQCLFIFCSSRRSRNFRKDNAAIKIDNNA